MDLGGPHPETPDGYQYVLFAIDYDDGWPEIVPLKDMTTEA